MSRESYATKTYKQHHTQTETKLGVFKEKKLNPRWLAGNSLLMAGRAEREREAKKMMI